MKLGRLMLLFVLALVLMFGPAVSEALAQDGTGQEVADTAEGWLNAVLVIGGIVLAVAGVILLLLVGNNLLTRLSITLPQIDANPAILAFGKSVPGRAINDFLGRTYEQVNEPTDPFIQRIEAMRWFKKAHELGLITGEQFSQLVSSAVANGIKLTNGVPDVEFNLLEYDSTEARG